MLAIGQTVRYQTERMPYMRTGTVVALDEPRNRVTIDDGGWKVGSLLSSMRLEDPVTGAHLNPPREETQPMSDQPTTKTCNDCGAPCTAKYCRACVVARQKTGRQAQLARERAARPPEPPKPPPGARVCTDCGVSIADRAQFAKYCVACSKARDKAAKRDYARRLQAAAKTAPAADAGKGVMTPSPAPSPVAIAASPRQSPEVGAGGVKTPPASGSCTLAELLARAEAHVREVQAEIELLRAAAGAEANLRTLIGG